MLPPPTVDHLSKRSFPHLPQWIQRTSTLIENPIEARDFLSKLGPEPGIWILISIVIFFGNLLLIMLLR